MKILFSDYPGNKGEDEFWKDLRTLPPWRRERALSYRQLSDRIQCSEAFLLLRRALKEEYGLADVPEFGYGPAGKPYLKGFPAIHFNLSHCSKGVMCVVDGSPVGCDIECIPDSPDTDVMQAAFSEDERRIIRGSQNPPLEYARLWTKKEALIKLSGKGIGDTDLPSLLQSPEAQGIGFIQGATKDYVWTVCYQKSPGQITSSRNSSKVMA